jgi:GT2 family glycosyltransferase
MMKPVPDLSIVIINTNNLVITLQCLEAVFQTAEDLQLEVIVVNNACTDGSNQAIPIRFPGIVTIEHADKLGFSTNNNLALARATGRYWMLLNDDTIVQPGALQSLVRFLDAHPEAGVVGAALFNQDGSAQYCYDFLPNPMYEGLRPLSEILHPHPSPTPDQPLETGYVCGAALVVRASAISGDQQGEEPLQNKVGFLDTRFDPLYSEEVDWCYRFKLAGWKVFHLPEARVIHLGEVSRRKASKKRFEQIYQKKAVFFRKYHGEKAVWIYKIFLFTSNLLKSGIWLFLKLLHRPGAYQELEVHWNIVRKVWQF